MTASDYVMLALPVGSFLIGLKRGELNNTNSFLFGFFCASLITLSVYAQGSDSGLDWLKV
jgi:hypothetical protein